MLAKMNSASLIIQSPWRLSLGRRSTDGRPIRTLFSVWLIRPRTGSDPHNVWRERKANRLLKSWRYDRTLGNHFLEGLEVDGLKQMAVDSRALRPNSVLV